VTGVVVDVTGLPGEGRARALGVKKTNVPVSLPLFFFFYST
jgi:hypothetical protein